MSQPKTWWLGLILLLVLWLLANWLETGAVERDLAGRAGAAIAATTALDSPRAEVAGRDVAVAGLTFSPERTAKAVAAAKATPGVRLASDATTAPPAAQPFVWSAKRDGAALVLSGTVPTPEARASILAAAKTAFPDVEIRDEATYATGAPGSFAAAAAYGLAQAVALSNGGVALSDAGYSIAGEAPTAAAYQAAMAATKALPAGVTLAKAEILPPELKPYVWSAANDGRTLTLGGAVPSEAARAELAGAAAAAFPGIRIVDGLQVARGAPAGDVLAAAKLGLAQLALLADGKAGLDDGRLSVSGSGKPGVTAAAIAAAIRSGLPQGFQLASVDVTPAIISPYTFSAEKSGGALTLSGYAPDDRTHQGILDAAQRLFFGETVKDQLALGAGAPEGFADAVLAGLGPLSRLAQGTLSLTGTDAKLSGQALYEKAVVDIQGAFAAALPGRYTADAWIAVKPPEPAVDAAACQDLFSTLLAKGTILFDTGKATISQESAGLLDNLVVVAQRCPEARIEISGHTDASGDAAANLDLSRKRAEAVVGYLETAGVAVVRLTAIGYGSARPIASNDTEEGRAQNRRIDFLVN
ncbi:OmpA family protein [Inquilinus sp. CA228]|uniref:OmpA family protein n=1 Tax=Inquilinus sp. CA228 TaxID=3455609 RepID=UPI003F8D204B